MRHHAEIDDTAELGRMYGMKKILIVEDHAIVRHGLIRTIQDVLEQQIKFDEAADGQQAIRMVDDHIYDLVLLDISLPDQSGLNMLKLLHKQKPKLPIIMLSSHPEEQYAVRTLKAGAAGYVNKGSAASILKEAIEKVFTGRRYISATQAELLADAVYDNQENRLFHESLSDREYELACMMAAGKTLTEIAKELSLNVKTVSTYRARVLEKLQLRTTADIISYCIQHNLSL